VGIPQYRIVEHSPAPRVQILTLDGNSYAADLAKASGVLVVTEIEADKSFTVSFDRRPYWSSQRSGHTGAHPHGTRIVSLR
jgi:hypothetical protein